MNPDTTNPDTTDPDMMNPDWIIPDWPAPGGVRALSTTRAGGVSEGPWSSLNLGCGGGDDPAAPKANRAVVRASLPAEPMWLHQVHGVEVCSVAGEVDVASRAGEPEADASVAFAPRQVCAVLAADCLPVLFCDRGATRVAAAHAGWRGLAAGVLENSVGALAVPPGELIAWLGPAIGPGSYEVGDDVLNAFTEDERIGSSAFHPHRDRWLFDLYAMARYRLNRAGVEAVFGGGFCTYSDQGRFFSYRRDGATGRMASLVWLENQ